MNPQASQQVAYQWVPEDNNNDLRRHGRVSLRSPAIWAQLVRQTYRNIKRSKVNYCLGFTACFIVVLVVSLMVTVLSKSPLIFLRLAELQQGEVDVKLLPGTFTGYTRLNYTLISKLLDEDKFSATHSPRLNFRAKLVAPSCPNDADLYEHYWAYSKSKWLNGNESCENTPGACFWQVCRNSRQQTVQFLAIDNRKEKDMQYGRGWNLPAEVGPGEVYVSGNVASQLGLSVGDVVMMMINLSYISHRDLIYNISNQYGEYNSSSLQFVETIWMPLKIKAIYNDNMGKLSVEVLDSIMVEYSSLLEWLLENANKQYVTPELKAALSKISLYDYAQEVAVNLPPPRLDAYMDTNYDRIQWSVVRFADDVLYRIGFSQVYVSMPVLQHLQKTKIISLFLGLILNVIIFILLFLSVVLIYSLLMISVETRTFELGILRMIGTTRRGIVALLLVQAFFYALPALVIGLLCSQGLNLIVSALITKLTGAQIGGLLTWQGVIGGVIMGLLVPIFSSILPIRAALGMNLQDSLDTKRSKTKAVEITVERSEDGSTISTPLLLIGAGLALFGAGTYYVLPLALLSFNLTLLMNMFVFLLVGMLLGLILLSLNVEHFIEQGIIYAFLWWNNAAIRAIVRKNLVAHRLRNRKTTILYALSLGFIIFVNVAYNLQVETFKYQQQARHGSYITVEAYRVDGTNNRVYSIKHSRPLLERVASTSPIVEDFCYMTFDIKDVVFDYKSVSIANTGQLFTHRQYVYGVSPNFWDVMFPQFLKVSESLYDGEHSMLASAMYSRNFSRHVVLGTLYKSQLALDLNSDFVFSIDQTSKQNPDLIIKRTRGAQVLSFMDSSARITMSKYPQIATQDVILSLPQFLRLTDGAYQSVEDLPIRFMIFKLKEHVTDDELDELVRRLNLAIIDQGVEVWDYRRTLGPFKIANVAMNVFFNFTTVVAMMISFFSLMSSMFTNIHEQTKEIGVLRAIGIPKGWMYRIYIFEAFVLVLSASLMGTIIGYLIGYTMTLQQVLFTQLPLAFDFPWLIMIVVFVCSILFSFLAAYSPIKSVLNRPVVQIFRILT